MAEALVPLRRHMEHAVWRTHLPCVCCLSDATSVQDGRHFEGLALQYVLLVYPSSAYLTPLAWWNGIAAVCYVLYAEEPL